MLLNDLTFPTTTWNERFLSSRSRTFLWISSMENFCKFLVWILIIMKNNDILMSVLFSEVFVKYNFARPNGQRVEVRNLSVLSSFVVFIHKKIIFPLRFFGKQPTDSAVYEIGFLKLFFLLSRHGLFFIVSLDVSDILKTVF